VSEEQSIPKALPRLERGRDLTRILAFTDGVFAIAITLLVLQIDVPRNVTSASDLVSKLGDQSPDFIAFAISFMVIGSFWISNHRFMRTVREFDRGLMLLLLLYLGVMVLIPFTSQLMGEYSESYDVSVVFYVVNMVAMAFASFLMFNHVLRGGLARPGYVWDVKLTRKSALFTAGVFVLSIPLVFVFGPWTPLVWLVLRWDPYQLRRDRIYDRAARASVADRPGGPGASAQAGTEEGSLADGDRGDAVDDAAPGE
jgi:uncharacterized membrane protein